MNKKVLIGLGVLAVAGIGLYIINKRRKDGETSSDENKSNAIGSLGSIGVGLGTGILNQVSCTSDQIACTKRGVASCCNKPKPVGTSTATASGVDGDCGSCPYKAECPRYLNSVDNNAPIFQGRRVASVATPYIPNFYYGGDGSSRVIRVKNIRASIANTPTSLQSNTLMVNPANF